MGLSYEKAHRCVFEMLAKGTTSSSQDAERRGEQQNSHK